MFAYAPVDSAKLLAAAKNHVRALFALESAPKYAYHNFDHTQMVVRDALWIGKGSELKQEQLLVVELAAWFHDTGFSRTYVAHEEEGAVLAKAFLSMHGVNGNLADDVADCIRATRMPQRPDGIVQQVLCDADLAYLGSNQFFDVSDKLLIEWQEHKQNDLDENEFSMVSEEFLLNHIYFTSFARTFLDSGKERNLRLLTTRNNSLRSI